MLLCNMSHVSSSVSCAFARGRFRMDSHISTKQDRGYFELVLILPVRDAVKDRIEAGVDECKNVQCIMTIYFNEIHLVKQ